MRSTPAAHAPAGATSTVIVAGTVVGAAATHLVQLVHEGGSPPSPGT